jgi:hypothetical protein
MAACSDHTGPTDVSGSYALNRVNDQRIPAVYVTQGCPVLVGGGGLYLAQDGTYAIDIQQRTACPWDSVMKNVAIAASGQYTLRGDSLILVGAGVMGVDTADLGFRAVRAGSSFRLHLHHPLLNQFGDPEFLVGPQVQSCSLCVVRRSRALDLSRPDHDL